MDRRKIREQARILRNKVATKSSRTNSQIRNKTIRIETPLAKNMELVLPPSDKGEARRKKAERILSQRVSMMSSENKKNSNLNKPCNSCKRKIGGK